MNNKILSIIGIVVLFVGIFTVFTTVAYAKGWNFLGVNKQDIIVTLKNEADIDKAKIAITNISGVKIVKIQDRTKEWSKMVNKMDLPNMENPFKNEFALKVNKKADKGEVFNKIKEMSFVEKVEYASDVEDKEKN